MLTSWVIFCCFRVQTCPIGSFRCFFICVKIGLTYCRGNILSSPQLFSGLLLTSCCKHGSSFLNMPWNSFVKEKHQVCECNWIQGVLNLPVMARHESKNNRSHLNVGWIRDCMSTHIVELHSELKFRCKNFSYVEKAVKNSHFAYCFTEATLNFRSQNALH